MNEIATYPSPITFTTKQTPMWLNNIIETIGNTPLIKINKITKDLPCTVLAKVEYLNYDIELSEPKFSELVVGYRYTPWAQFNILAQIKKTNNSIDSIYCYLPV